MHPDDLTDDQPHLASPLRACSNWIKASLLSGSSYFIPNSFKDSNELKITDFYYYKLQMCQCPKTNLAEPDTLLDAVLETLHQPLLQPVLLFDHAIQQALEKGPIVFTVVF